MEGLQVVQQTSASMIIVVGQGSASFNVGTYPSSYRITGWIDTTAGSPAGETVTIGTAPTSNSRIDAVVAYLDFSATTSAGTANNSNAVLKLMVVAGTAAASPSAPSNTAVQTAVGASNPFTRLANVTVGTNVTQITNANIADTRAFIIPKTNPYAFSIYRNTAYTLASAASTRMPFDAKNFDYAGLADVSTNFGRYTARADCDVFVEAAINLSTTGATRFFISIFKNGAEVRRSPDPNLSGGNIYSNSVSGFVQLAATDYLEIFYFCNAASQTAVTGQTTSFSGYVVSAS